MGKLNKQSDSEEDVRMDVEKPQPPAKRKLIKKKVEKPMLQPAQQRANNAKSQSLANKSVKKYSKLVNLQKVPVDLAEKQGIFKKVVHDLKGDKKVSRKLRKKQRVQIKKELRKELEEKLPVVAVPEGSGGQAMQEQRSTVRREKFEEKKVVQQFKKNMGLKFSSLKNMLARKAAS